MNHFWLLFADKMDQMWDFYLTTNPAKGWILLSYFYILYQNCVWFLQKVDKPEDKQKLCSLIYHTFTAPYKYKIHIQANLKK